MALSDIYKQRSKDLDKLRKALKLPAQTVGIAVYLGKRFHGFDLFDRASTFQHYWKALIDSYALDWLAYKPKADDDAGEGNELGSVDDLVGTLRAALWERFESPGEGSDLRWESERLTASALAWSNESGVWACLPRGMGASRP
jgi:hypothetical protein